MYTFHSLRFKIEKFVSFLLYIPKKCYFYVM